MALSRFALLVLAVPLFAATPPVQLAPYPQKVRTFFKVDDPAVPGPVREDAAPSAVRASDGALWSIVAEGLLRVDERAPERDRRQFLGGRRYVPEGEIMRLVPDAAGGVWVRAKGGVAHIELRSMSLAQKAEIMEQNVQQRHDRYGMLGDSALRVPGDLSTNVHLDNDNNGLWTSIYAAAECFRFAVTRSPAALAQARKAVDALLFLEEVTGKRGFPARSFIRKGDRLPTDGEWHWTADGQIYWKGDTSSDEIVGHLFAFGIAFDLLPDGEQRQRIAAATRRIVDHIISHGYYLVDVDGKPTTWGKWSPKYFAEDPEDSALNALELLSFLKTAAHITGEARFETEYRKVAHEMKYADLMLQLNKVRVEMNYSDEELAFLPLYAVFRYEKDPALLAKYRQAMDEWWKNAQRELCPLWTVIYLTGRPDATVDLAGAVWTLNRMPLDLVKWDVKNSHRGDIAWATAMDRHGRREALTLLPPDERPVMRWNANPFVVDGGGGGRSESDGAAFLLPYWMGRHHKFFLGE